MTETEIYTAPVRDGAMISAPVYESHKRGGYYYLIRDGQIVGAGADYFSAGGKRHRSRWYGVVRALTGEEIRIEQYETAAQAIAATRTGPDRQALEEERSALLGEDQV